MLTNNTIGVSGHGVKLFLTDLPWGDTEKTGYETEPDFVQLADFFNVLFNSTDGLSKDLIEPDLGRKRKRGGKGQESILVAMGNTPALGELKAQLVKKGITVCSNIECLMVAYKMVSPRLVLARHDRQ